MDPVSALGLAINILTVIDFSYKIISAATEIAARGKTKENDDIEVVIEDLDAINQKLMSPINGASEHETALRALAEKSHDISGELQGILTKLKVEKGAAKIQSLAKAIRAAYHKQDISDRLKTLDLYRMEVLTRLVLVVK